MEQFQAPLTTDVRTVIAGRALTSVFQPIVELDSGRVVAYEALARGPQGPLQSPDALFAAARADGCLTELDQACRAAALRGAVGAGLLAPLTVFVNVEPDALDEAPLAALFDRADRVAGDMRVVLEITERALAARPAELLRTVARVREHGWAIALDDVGAESLSLAFMPLLRPDVVKLDLRLVQGRPGPPTAEVMHAVNAYAEASGAVVLAEGIEDDGHLAVARALGATLGQGWLFGRPGLRLVADRPAGLLRLPAPHPVDPPGEFVSPFACLPAGAPLREGSKALLVEVSTQLERQAMRLGKTCVVATAFQAARHVTPATRLRYQDLVERVGFVAALAEELTDDPLPELRNADLLPDDPVRCEWDIAVLSPHFSAALLARDLGDDGPDADRRFAFALTYERDTVVRATRALLSRVVPRVEGSPVPDEVLSTTTTTPAAARPLGAEPAGDVGAALLRRAMAAVGTGITIVDVRRPDQPLVYVNPAFELLSGYPEVELLGRNCRFLQHPDTDPGAVARLRAGISAGEECREVLLNRRVGGGTWWNECHLTPVTDASGEVVQYIGVQTDVTARVEAERALVTERERSRRYAARLAQLDGPAGTSRVAVPAQSSTDSPGVSRS